MVNIWVWMSGNNRSWQQLGVRLFIDGTTLYQPSDTSETGVVGGFVRVTNARRFQRLVRGILRNIRFIQ